MGEFFFANEKFLFLDVTSLKLLRSLSLENKKKYFPVFKKGKVFSPRLTIFCLAGARFSGGFVFTGGVTGAIVSALLASGLRANL